VGPRVGLIGCVKYRHQGDMINGPFSPQRFVTQTELSRPTLEEVSRALITEDHVLNLRHQCGVYSELNCMFSSHNFDIGLFNVMYTYLYVYYV